MALSIEISTGSEINEDLHDSVGISLGTPVGGLKAMGSYSTPFLRYIFSMDTLVKKRSEVLAPNILLRKLVEKVLRRPSDHSI